MGQDSPADPVSGRTARTTLSADEADKGVHDFFIAIDFNLMNVRLR